MEVLCFIDTEDAGSTKAVIPYLSEYPYKFTNIDIHPFDTSLVVSKFSGYMNEVDSKNNTGSMIYRWKSTGLLGVVGYGYI